MLNIKDCFGPVSNPKSSYLTLPSNIEIQWISSEDDVILLQKMVGSQFIGVDSEWRLSRSKHDNIKPSLLQLSSQSQVFLVDLISLQENKRFNDMMTLMFHNRHSTIVGFGFVSDLEEFVNKLPKLTFINNIVKFIDAQAYYSKVFGIK